jgi:hypothetical protein
METRNERLIEAFENYDSLKHYVDFNSQTLKDNMFETSEYLREYLEERIRETEIVYYTTAMDYLKDNDNSLRTSLEIASNYGYELKNLSSEILASLLLQEDLMEELINFINEVEQEEIFND